MERWSSTVINSWLLIAGFGLWAMLAGTALAVEDGDRFQDWATRCQENPSTGNRECLIYQTLAGEEDDEPVLQISVGYTGPQRQPAVLVIVPLGVALEPGMQIQVDEESPFQVNFNHCNRVGCVAGFSLDQQRIDQMKAGITAKISVFDLGGGQINMDISLRGFTAGFNAIGS